MDEEGREEDERAFERLQEVLGGARVALDGRAAKVLALILAEDQDVEITRARLAYHSGPTRSRYPRDYFRRVAPGVVSFLLEHGTAGPGAVTAPLVLGLPAGVIRGPDPDTPYAAKRVWILPGDAVVKLFVRPSPDPLEAPFARPIPAEGSLPLRERPLYTQEYIDAPAPITCPHCKRTATRHRATVGARVCPHCHRSFATT